MTKMFFDVFPTLEVNGDMKKTVIRDGSYQGRNES
jgi:hypothetical protein